MRSEWAQYFLLGRKEVKKREDEREGQVARTFFTFLEPCRRAFPRRPRCPCSTLCRAGPTLPFSLYPILLEEATRPQTFNLLTKGELVRVLLTNQSRLRSVPDLSIATELILLQEE
jgi:hypothetical protein